MNLLYMEHNTKSDSTGRVNLGESSHLAIAKRMANHTQSVSTPLPPLVTVTT